MVVFVVFVFFLLEPISPNFVLLLSVVLPDFDDYRLDRNVIRIVIPGYNFSSSILPKLSIFPISRCLLR